MDVFIMKYRVEEVLNFIVKFRDKTVLEFSYVRFMCLVIGFFVFRIIWQKDGKDIINNINFFILVRFYFICKNNCFMKEKIQ